MHFPYTSAVCGTRPLPRSFATRSFGHPPLSFLYPRFAIATPLTPVWASERANGGGYNARNPIWKVWAILEILGHANRGFPGESRPVSSRPVASRRADKSLRRSNKIDLADRHLSLSLSEWSGPTRQQVLSARNCSEKRDSPSGAIRSPWVNLRTTMIPSSSRRLRNLGPGRQNCFGLQIFCWQMNSIDEIRENENNGSLLGRQGII